MLPQRVADKYYNVRKTLTKQLHKTASTIGFIKISLRNNVIPRLAKVKGTFLREELQHKYEEDIMKSHLKEHQNNLSRVMKYLSKDKDSIVNMIGVSFTLVLLKSISKEQYQRTILSFSNQKQNIETFD